ncbi:ATP-binding protein [Streptomyces buecherae]|uniref:ATP-binding protein n=1 Tax=Streptomyces buecherae TaxID=2763006 RepID=UPI001C260992|nr:ATP-binding protein [Streptomyces buecherae]
MDTDRVIESVRRYVAQRGWVVSAEFVDWARVGEAPSWTRPRFRQALAAVEAGQASGIVTPSMGMVAASPEEETALAQWQRRALGQGPFLSAPALAYALRPQERTVCARPEAVGEVRAWVAQCLRPLAPAPEVLDAVLLCTTELVTNAVNHAVPARVRASVTVNVSFDVSHVYIAVKDPAPHLLPKLVSHPAEELDGNGRGLLLVEELSERWGHSLSQRTKQVWCAFPHHSTYGQVA